MSDLDVDKLVAYLWQWLLEKDDRTSPEEYPEMCLITREELFEVIEEAREDLSARIKELEGEKPSQPGGFEGDIFFGDPRNSTRGTHRWANGGWEELPSEESVLMEMLADARSRAQSAEAQLTELRALSEAVVTQWDSPNWKLTEPTASIIGRLRDGLERLKVSASGCS